MYKRVKKDEQSNYFGKIKFYISSNLCYVFLGVGEFVDETENKQTKDLLTLTPGTFTDDDVYEQMVKPESDSKSDPDSFYNYVKQVNDGLLNDEQAARFYGLLLLYVGKGFFYYSNERALKI